MRLVQYMSNVYINTLVLAVLRHFRAEPISADERGSLTWPASDSSGTVKWRTDLDILSSNMSDSGQPEREWDEVYKFVLIFQQIGIYTNSVRPGRRRSFPLVPEPYCELVRSRQCVFLRVKRMAEQWCKFCPDLNISRYRATLSAEDQAQLGLRASKLQRHAVRLCRVCIK